MRQLKQVLTCLSAATLVACGGGGGGNGSPIAAGVHTGQFWDAPTKGLEYVASPSGLNGTTNDNGEFLFQTGDSVSFSIKTTNGNIDIGVAKPAAPARTSEKSVLHVSVLDNGPQIAATLQSLGGGSSATVLDVSNQTNLTAADVSAINSYISTAGISNKPPAITVSQTEAFSSAMDSLIRLPPVEPVTPLSTFLSGAVVAAIGTLDAVVSSGNWAGKTIKIRTDKLVYLKSDQKTYEMCLNLPWIDSKTTSDSGVNCDTTKSLITQTGTWSVPADSKSYFELTSNEYPTFLNTATFLSINSKEGLFKTSQPNSYTTPFGAVASFTGSGSYVFLKPDTDKKDFAGKSIDTTGASQCVDGMLTFLFNAQGDGFVRKCKSGKTDGSTNSEISGAVTGGLDIPGIWKITPSNGERAVYVGLTNESTEKSGRLVIVNPGDNRCGTAAGKSLIYCGGIRIVSFSN